MTEGGGRAATAGRIKARGGVEIPLKGWREIAGFLGRDQSTVRRWAEARGLPVFRTSKGGRGVPVHANGSELQAWLRDEARRGGMDTHAPAIAGEHRGEGDGGAAERPAIRAAHEHGPAAPRLAFVVGPCLGIGFLLGAAAVLGGVFLAGRGQPEAVAAGDVPEAARDLYVRGSFLWSRHDPESVAEAILLLRQAVAIRPDYAQAHAALATSYNLAERYSVMSGWEAFPKAERAARRAIELDPGLDLAQGALAFAEFQLHRDVAASLARFDAALRHNPGSANTLFWYANVLLMAGRADEALPLVIRAEEIAPERSAFRTLHAQILCVAGRTAECIAMLDDIVARDPGHPWPRHVMSLARLARQDYPAWLESYAAFGDMIGVPRYRQAAASGEAALRTGGVAAMAGAMAAVDAGHYQRGEALAVEVARHYAIGGLADEAMSWLRIALNRHEARLMTILADPAFRPIGDDPRFRDLLAALGLPAR